MIKKYLPKGNSYDGSSQYKEKKNHSILAIIIVFLFLLLFGFIIYKSSKSKACNDIEKLILKQVQLYAENNHLLPEIEGESVTIAIDEVFAKETLKPKIKQKICSGSVKITKYKEEYIKTYDITNCDYCSVDARYKDWSKEVSKKPSGKVITDVIPYYNYYEIGYYHSSWTNWISEDEIEKTDNNEMALPIEKDILPKIPSEATIIQYEKEEETWFRYRDKQWKYYRDNGGTYSSFSSEQPAGFLNADTSTEILTEWSEWSLNYPDKKSYRTIDSQSGYRWYYMDGKKKIYWNSGAYSPTNPDEKYNKKDNEAVTLYRYRDKKWRWYNGAKRNYSSYSSTPSASYPYRDEELFDYTSWSSYSSENKLDASNAWYREIESKAYYRYRIYYSMKSFLKLNSHVSKEEFEQMLEQPTLEIMKRDDIKVDIIYKFKYRKK